MSMAGQSEAECEIPFVFFARLDGSSVQPVTGEKDWANIVSIAYGWTTDGRAIVPLPHDFCAGTPWKGMYLIDRSRRRTPIHPVHVIPRSTQARPASMFRP